MSGMSYDPKCEELARYFMDDLVKSDGDVQELARAIQQAVEDFLSEEGNI